MDKPSDRTSHSRQSYECLHPLQTGNHGAATDDQTIQSGSLGAGDRWAICTHRTVVGAAGGSPSPLDHIPPLHEAGGFRPNDQPSRKRSDDIGPDAAAVFMAWATSRHSDHCVARADGLVESVEAAWRKCGD